MSGSYLRLQLGGSTYDAASKYAYPGPDWSGTIGSGYNGRTQNAPLPVATVDADRTGPMPIMMPMTLPYEVFMADGYIGCYAWMDPALGGIASVTLNIEGRTVTETEVTPRTRTNIRTGLPVIEWAYWFQVKADYFNSYGSWECFFIATPTNYPTYQQRTIGPYVYWRDNELYDTTVTITSGTATAINTALLAAKTELQTSSRVRFLIQNNGPFLFTQDLNIGSVARTSWLVVEPDTGYTPVFSGTDGTFIDWRNRLNNIMFRGITFDRKNISSIYCEDIGPSNKWYMAFEGCEVYDSEGRYAVHNGVFKPGFVRDMADSSLPGINQQLWLKDTWFHAIGTGPKFSHIRDCKYTDLATDVATSAHSAFYIWAEDNNSAPPRVGVDAARMTYTGSATTATGTLTGTNQGARTLTIRLDGVTAFTLAIGSDTVHTTGKISEVAAAVNASGVAGLAMTDPSGTQSYNDAVAASCLYFGVVGSNPSFNKDTGTTANLKNLSAVMVTAYDLHGDVFQYSVGSQQQNVLLCNITNINSTGYQTIFTPRTVASGGLQDWACLNMISDTTYTENYNSQPGPGTTATRSHYNVIYCQFPDQDWSMTAGAQFSNSRWAGLVCKDAYGAMNGTGTAVDNAVKMVSVQTTPAFMDITLSTLAACYVDYAGGDYRAKIGGPLDVGHTPLVPFDINGESRGLVTIYSPYATAG